MGGQLAAEAGGRGHATGDGEIEDDRGWWQASEGERGRERERESKECSLPSCRVAQAFSVSIYCSDLLRKKLHRTFFR